MEILNKEKYKIAINNYVLLVGKYEYIKIVFKLPRIQTSPLLPILLWLEGIGDNKLE
jgi:hypothetical protein